MLDIVGASYFEKNCASLAQDGRLIIIGTFGGATLSKFEIMPFIQKRLRLMGSTLRTRTQQQKAEIAASLSKNVWPILESHQCLPPVAKSFKLNDVVKAHELMEHGDFVGKIVLEVS